MGCRLRQGHYLYLLLLLLLLVWGKWLGAPPLLLLRPSTQLLLRYCSIVQQRGSMQLCLVG
jgi:hypothetical protein